MEPHGPARSTQLYAPRGEHPVPGDQFFPGSTCGLLGAGMIVRPFCLVAILAAAALFFPLASHAIHDQASADLSLEGAEFYQPGAIRFYIRNPAYHSPVIGSAETQAPVIVRFAWLDQKKARTIASRDLDLTAVLRTALNGTVRDTAGRSFRFDSLPYSAVNEMLATPTIATAEAKYLRITVDTGSAVAEADENNNDVTLRRSLPDLKFIGGATAFRDHVIFAVLQEPRSYFLGGDHALKLRFSWLDRKKNRLGGWHDWDAAYFVSQGSRPGLSRISGEPALLTFDSARSLEGMPALRTFLQTPPAGSRYLRVAIDAANVIAEEREDNNHRDLSRPLADLAIRNVSWLEFADDGRTWPWRHLEFDIVNRGTAHPFAYTGGNIGLRFSWRSATSQLGGSITWDAQDLIISTAMQRNGTVHFDSTAEAARSVNTWLHQTRPKGATRIYIEVDVLNLIEESDEANNKYATAVGGITKGIMTRTATKPSFWTRLFSRWLKLF